MTTDGFLYSLIPGVGAWGGALFYFTASGVGVPGRFLLFESIRVDNTIDCFSGVYIDDRYLNMIIHVQECLEIHSADANSKSSKIPSVFVFCTIYFDDDEAEGIYFPEDDPDKW